MKLCRKASINRDVGQSCLSVRVPGSAALHSSSRLSVILRVLCCVQVHHLELRQVTAAAARLLANHHLEHNTATSGGVTDSQSHVITSHNTWHRWKSCYATCCLSWSSVKLQQKLVFSTISKRMVHPKMKILP